MKLYQENWLESLQEFTTPWNKHNMDNNVLGICCKIIGDDTGHTDPLTQELASILKNFIIQKNFHV